MKKILQGDDKWEQDAEERIRCKGEIGVTGRTEKNA
jgi:hypothetical protein